MNNNKIIKGIIEDLELLTEDDLPFDKCDENCEECENVCEVFFREDALTQLEILHRFCRREYTETKPEYRWNASLSIKTICDILGWNDFDFSKEDKK